MPAKIQHPFKQQRPRALRRYVTPTTAGAVLSATVLMYPALILDDASDWAGNRLLQAFVGFVGGYCGYLLLNYFRLRLLTAMLAYDGWVTAPKSIKTKVWALLVSALRGQAPFMTFQFQPLLPSQPLPSLDATLDRWLMVTKNFLTSQDHEQTQEAVAEFRNTSGPKIHAFLEKKAAEQDSWLSDYWLNGAYLSSRQPLAAYSNYFISHRHKLDAVDQLSRAATLTHWLARLEQRLAAEDFTPVFLQKLVPLCMHGYNYMFNASRVPGEHIDQLVRYPGHRFIIVIRKGHYYKLELYALNDAGESVLLTPHDIRLQLDDVIRDADALDHQLPVAALTAQNRTNWAKVRSRLAQRNDAIVSDIDRAMFIVALDEKTPEDYADLAKRSLLGDGCTTWFDKCLTMTCFANGWIANNIEHSALDAMVFINVEEYILVHESYIDGRVAFETSTRCAPKPKRLVWDLRDVEADIAQAMTEFQALSDDVKLCVYHPPYGKGFMKKQRLSPDGYIQMALQLAYYRLHQYVPKTYEPSTHRLYLLGRTETTHPASAASVMWLDAMQKGDRCSVSTRRELLRRAVSSQTSHRLEATIGRGCDRHLMGLMCAARELGMDLPRIFTDKAWTMPFELSTSQTPNNFAEYGCELDYTSCVGGFAPTAPDGYGIAYCILGDDVINFQVSSWVSASRCDASEFIDVLNEVFVDMKKLCLD